MIEPCDNNLASELVENRSFFKPITIEEIVIFMITAFMLLPELFLQIYWLRGEEFYLNFKYIHVKIIVTMVTKNTSNSLLKYVKTPQKSTRYTKLKTVLKII